MHGSNYPTTIKLVIVGDGGVGKTSLLIAHASNTFTADYTPTVFDYYAAHHAVDDTTVMLDLFDTGGQPDHDRLRPLVYPQTDVFLVCFSIADPGSYKNIMTKWHPEISHHEPTIAGTGIVLVGTKLDLRQDQAVLAKLRDRHMTPITYQQGVAMAQGINAARYCECSALTQEGVKATFEEAMRVGLQTHHSSKKKKKRACIVI